MYKLGETFQRDGFLELRQEGDLYLFSLGDCFDDGGEGVCMPLFSFTKKIDDMVGGVFCPQQTSGSIEAPCSKLQGIFEM
jgi:hypothetical protein